MMFITALLSAGSAMAGSADSIDHELSLELGSMHSSDPTWDAFSDSEQVIAWGIRGGYGISPRLAVVASWHRGQHDSYFEVEAETYHDLDMDFTTNQFAIGPKVDFQIDHWFRPYVTLQGMGMLGQIRIDEDPDDDDNELLKFSDTGFGGFAAAGIDFIPGSSDKRLHFASHIEWGYGKVFALQFEDKDAGNDAVEIGDLDLQGFTINWGVGVRF